MSMPTGKYHLLAYRELASAFGYNSMTGAITRLTGSHRGKLAGCIDGKGYRRINFKGMTLPGSHLAWMLHFGHWPEAELDHKDLNRAHDAISNLRLSNVRLNQANIGKRRGTYSSPIKGITLHKVTGKWQAQIKHMGKNIHLGLYRTEHDAAIAYYAAAKTIFGKFARAA